MHLKNSSTIAKITAAGVFTLCGCSDSGQKTAKLKNTKPNIIYILADDLGYSELGCYGQEKIKTPSLDKLAADGIRFTQHYSGSTVSAPSRCVLLTGKHTGNSFVRDNYEMGGWADDDEGGQLALPPGTFTIGSMLKDIGYKTAAIGKWGLGGPGSEGVPNNHGFDLFYGYLCQKQAHNYYPSHLWLNQEWDTLANEYFMPHEKLKGDENDPRSYDKFKGEDYSLDKMGDKALEFIKNNKNNPFFLYVPFTVPHVSLQVPDEYIEEYGYDFPETPYKGEKGYLPHQFPRAAYAAMITRMDAIIGEIVKLVKNLGLDDNTLIMFSSDNGTTFNGGSDAEFFESVKPLSGLKCSVYEGGIRVPMIACWPGKIKPGVVSDHISAFWDVLPTISEITGAETPADIDGISMLPTLFGKGNQKKHDYLYWEYHSRGSSQAVRMDEWKAVVNNITNTPEKVIELYNLKDDIAEKNDVSQENPEVIEKIKEILNSRTESHIERWNFKKKTK
ncbi:arylsulfatase [Bacteroidota bacterium]